MNLPATDMNQTLHQELARKQAIAKRFGDAARVYDEKAMVQKQVSTAGLEMLRSLVSQPVSHAVDLGCGTGFDTHHLLDMAHKVTGADLSPGMIKFAMEQHCEPKLSWLVADAEDMPLQSAEVDLLFSSMALQWLSDTQQIARECFRIISKGGRGVIAVVLQDSLFELHNSWLKMTDCPPVNQFFPGNKWLISFKNAGFKCSLETREFTTWHEDVFAVLHSIKDVGAGVVLADSKPNLLRKTNLKLLNQTYKRDYPAAQGLPLTWKIGFLQFEKP